MSTGPIPPEQYPRSPEQPSQVPPSAGIYGQVPQPQQPNPQVTSQTYVQPNQYQQPSVQQPYGQQPYGQSSQYAPTGSQAYPGIPEKKSGGGNAFLIIMVVVLALAAIGGWALYYIRNNALNLANAEIAKKNTEISNLNSDLDTANAKITDMTKQIKDKDSKIASLNGQITELTNSYICSGVSISSFSFYDADSVLDSLETYVNNKYGYFTSSGGAYLQNYGDSAVLYVNQGDYSYYFVAYFGGESKTGGNRIYDINNECFIE
jgi:cell division protein FtsL